MKALFATGRRDQPLVWETVEAPEIIEPTDVIIRPMAVAACDLDRAIVQGRSPFPGSFMLGHEFTGEIIAVGDDVKNFGRGDIVLASFQPSCGTCPHCVRKHSSVCGSVPIGTMYGIGQTGGDWGGALAEALRVPWAGHNLAKLSDEKDFARVASASDNLADGLRAVDGPLQRNPNANVLIAGSGSIPLYAALCAAHFGAEAISIASDDQFVLDSAEALGATALPVTKWPKRFSDHDITVDCTNSVEGLTAVLKSTTPYGESTSCSIFFGGEIPVPMFNLNMRGIAFHTGRVNSASNLERVLGLVAEGLDPERINPAYCSFAEAIDALVSEPFSRKVIACS